MEWPLLLLHAPLHWGWVCPHGQSELSRDQKVQIESPLEQLLYEPPFTAAPKLAWILSQEVIAWSLDDVAAFFPSCNIHLWLWWVGWAT